MTDELFDKARASLKQYWGFDDFRPGQDEVVRSVLSGEPTLVLFPTGGGKSLCYQVPATVLEGLTVVISPLVALMQDQVFQLQQKGVPSTFINSTISRSEVEQRLINARNGMYKLLYCAPERLETPLWQNMVTDLSLSLIAVDEAHCISEWGHDFRPIYRRIPEMMAPVAGRIRWLALTATATPEVRRDIVQALDLKEPAVISRGFNRPNLQWWVIIGEQKKRRLKKILQRAKGSGLIYAGTRAGCEHLSDWLTRQGWHCEPYHAGLTAEQREDIQNRWIDSRLPLVAATNAFGMGIDKPDCRFVVHYDMSLSIEAYYQEAGRAGRDGKESYPILLVREADLKAAKKAILDSWPDRQQLEKIYNAVCDHWNLASGSAMEEMQKIDLDQVRIRSGFSVRMILSGLRILDQLGVLKMAQQEEPRVGIHFLLSREAVEERSLGLNKPAKQAFIDRLSRIMGPEVYQKMTYMEERHLKTRMEMSGKMLENGLRVLQDEGWLNYSLIRNEPVAHLMEPRYQRFQLTEKNILEHRDRLLKKLDYMIGFVRTKSCRSRYIRIYFGETNVPQKCGTCDNCRSEKKAGTLSGDIQTISKILESEAMDFKQLLQKTRWPRMHLKQVLSDMLREELICRPDDGSQRYRLP